MATTICKNSVLTATGMKMPFIGLGTWRSTEEEIKTAVDAALEAGYRHIDTAAVYRNEAAIGKALKSWIDSGKIKREDLFIVTKLASTSMEAQYVEESLTESLKNLQLSYVDLYLVHQPIGLEHGLGPLPRHPDGSLRLDLNTDHIAIWKAMEAQVDAGRTKAIGVSNFNIRQIDRILKSCRIPPSANQVEMHTYSQRNKLREFGKKNGVIITAFAPLGSPGLEDFAKGLPEKMDEIKHPSPLTDPVVIRIAKAHKKTPAQVLLRHLMQLGVSVIPKSTNPKRIDENFNVFDFVLGSADMEELNALDKGIEGLRFKNLLISASKHPEFPHPD